MASLRSAEGGAQPPSRMNARTPRWYQVELFCQNGKIPYTVQHPHIRVTHSCVT